MQHAVNMPDTGLNPVVRAGGSNGQANRFSSRRRKFLSNSSSINNQNVSSLGAALTDYDDGGRLPYRKKAKKIDRSKCQHEFKETKRTEYTWSKTRVVYVRLRCTKCKKRQYQDIYLPL